MAAAIQKGCCMPRVSEVAYERVAQACVELFQAGDTVSFAKVYALIGQRGGQQVVSEMIRRWKQEVAARLLAQRQSPQLPAALVGHADHLVQALWQAALAEGEQALAERSEALAQQVLAWQAQLAQADARVAECERAHLHVQGERDALEAAWRERGDTLTLLQQQHHELQQQHASGLQDLSAARSQLVEREAQWQQQQLLHDKHLQALKAQFADERQQADARADADRRHLLQQSDALRQTHRSQIEALRQQLEAMGQRLEQHSQQAEAQRDEAFRWQGRAEALQTEARRWQLQAESSTELAAQWQGRARRLQEELDALQQRWGPLWQRLLVQAERAAQGQGVDAVAEPEVDSAPVPVHPVPPPTAPE